METNTAINAAAFCNGSLAEDTATLKAAIATGDSFEMDLAVTNLATEATNALQDIAMNAPDDPSELEYKDFLAYYKGMAKDLSEA